MCPSDGDGGSSFWGRGRLSRPELRARSSDRALVSADADRDPACRWPVLARVGMTSSFRERRARHRCGGGRLESSWQREAQQIRMTSPTPLRRGDSESDHGKTSSTCVATRSTCFGRTAAARTEWTSSTYLVTSSPCFGRSGSEPAPSERPTASDRVPASARSLDAHGEKAMLQHAPRLALRGTARREAGGLPGRPLHGREGPSPLEKAPDRPRTKRPTPARRQRRRSPGDWHRPCGRSTISGGGLSSIADHGYAAGFLADPSVSWCSPVRPFLGNGTLLWDGCRHRGRRPRQLAGEWPGFAAQPGW